MPKHPRFLSLRASDDLVTRLRQRALAEDRSLGSVIRRILQAACDAPHA